MFKLMIVDDEFNIRDGIANAVDWGKYDVEVVAVAVDGFDALDKMKAANPDIVITDIYMDNMDGLQLAGKIKDEFPQTRVIIVSGYDDFEYAKKAIDLKVFSYLLKPVLPNRLIEAVCSLKNEIIEDRMLTNKMSILEEKVKENYPLFLDGFLCGLIKGTIADKTELGQMEEFLNIKFDHPNYGCILLNIDSDPSLADSSTPREMYTLLVGIKEIVNEILAVYYQPYTILHDSKNVVSILGCRSGEDKKFRLLLYESVEKIKDKVQVIFGRTVTVGIGGFTDDILEIGKNYAAALRALDYRMTVGKNSIIHIDDVASMEGRTFIYPSDIEMKIIQHLKLGDRNGVELTIGAFFKSMAAQNYSRDVVRTIVLQLFATVAGKFMGKGVNIYNLYDQKLVDPMTEMDKFHTIDEIRKWLTNIVTDAIDFMRRNIKSKAQTIVKKVQNYILEHYADSDVSLVSIAEHVHMNPSYLSKLYKEETGEAYIEFLTNVRIDHAKRLLRGSYEKIAGIGTAVGYLNPQYFCTLFKKHTGFSPIAYRLQQI